MTRKIFGKTCLFLLAATFLFENAGFLTHELSIAAGIIFLTALTVSYFPVKRGTPAEKMPADLIVRGIVLMAIGVAVVPVSEFLRPAGVSIFALGLGLLMKGLGQEAPELGLFAITAAGYGVFNVFYRVSPHVWSVVNGACFGFSRLVAAVTDWLPGPKALLGPAFLGAGTIVTFALFFIVGSFMLKPNGRNHFFAKLAKALAAMVACGAVYVIAFTYVPSAFQYQLKLGPVPSEAEKNTTKQAKEQFRDRDAPRQATESEKATNVVFSTDMFEVEKGTPWMPIVLFGFLLIPSYFFVKGVELRPLPVLGKTQLAAGGVVLLVLFGFTQAIELNVPSAKARQEAVSQKRVAFYYHGFANWARADFNSFGSRSSGMFGNLPDFVESMGFRQPVAEPLGGIAFPSSREKIVSHAKAQGASAEIMTILGRLPERDYRDVADVEREAAIAHIMACTEGISFPTTKQQLIAYMAERSPERTVQSLSQGLDRLQARSFASREELARQVAAAAPPAKLLSRGEIGYLNSGSIITEITPATLTGVDVLMLLNVDDMFNVEDPPYGVDLSADQLARKNALAACKTDDERIALMRKHHQEALNLIWSFVADGGSLLIIGDHTFLKETQLPGGRVETKLWLNDVLEPFDIKFVNDSAKYFIGGWLQSMENPVHPLTWGLRDDQNEVGMVVGASLSITGAARPIIVGRYGFLDAGDMREGGRGYLGNLDFDMGEPLGQTIIAATQQFGKGRLLVFGDTSAFANGIITNTGEFVNRVFTYMALTHGRATVRTGGVALRSALDPSKFDASSVSRPTGLPMAVLAVILLAGAAVCLAMSGGASEVVAGAFVVCALIGFRGTDMSVKLGPGGNRSVRDAGAIRVAYVDSYHMPKISNEGWRDDGVMGVHLNLMRNGFYTQNLKSFDLETLQKAALLVIVAPSREFSRSDVQTVLEYVAGGGTVILTSGYEDLAATRRLLDAFNLDIPYTPLGRFMIPVAAAGGQYVRFWRIWPVVPTANAENVEVIIPYEPNPGNKFNLGVRRPYGANGGSFILIADSGLWMNKNLEREETHDKESIYFMKWMLEEIKK